MSKKVKTTVQDLENFLNCPVSQWYTLQKVNLHDKNINYLPPEVGNWQNAQYIYLS